MVKFLAFLVFATSAMASNVLLYDPQSFGVSNRPYALLSSVNTPDYAGLTNALINPTLPGSGTLSDWKVITNAVVLLDANDLNAISNATAIALTNKLVQSVAGARTNAFQLLFSMQEYNQVALKSAVDSIEELLLPQINTLRASNGLPAITDFIAKSNMYRLITNKINAAYP